MELRQLRYFAAVAEELHFGRAAAKLHMSQPPLSVHIRELERELDVRLLHRSTRKVTLTAAGEAFQLRVQHILAELDEAVVEAQDFRDGRRGRVRVGFVSSASVTVIPAAVRRFRALHPRVDLVLNPLTSSEQLEALYAGGLDIGVVRDITAGPAVAAIEPLIGESMVAVLPARHPLATRELVTVADLVDEPLILFPGKLMPGFVTRVWEMFRAIGASPQVLQEAIHHETVVGLVSAGVGLSVLPASVSRFRPEEVVIRPIESAPQTSLMIARAAQTTTPVVDSFIQCLRYGSAEPDDSDIVLDL